MMKLSPVLLLVFLLMPTFSWAKTTILVVGDSLSAAYGIPKQSGWVALMEQKVKQKFPQAKIINASISGETSLGGRQRIETLVKQHTPTITVIELGANDGLRGLSNKKLAENLAFMIEAAQKQGSQVVLVKMLLPPNYGPAYTQQFAKVFDELVARYQLNKAPFLLQGLQDQDFQQDMLHPTAAAQTKLLQTMWPNIDQLLNRSARK